jgi:hypothetical protein
MGGEAVEIITGASGVGVGALPTSSASRPRCDTIIQLCQKIALMLKKATQNTFLVLANKERSLLECS